MSKVAHYLQEHLTGEVMTSTDARRYFATDGSILQIAPSLVVYPKNENDVRKAARFTWQLAERGRVIPMTARGAGTGQAGAALGSGIMLVFPAHMNRILEIDTKANNVTVEPGISCGRVEQTLLTHSRFLPPIPATADYSTIGGAIANNTAGEKSVKYGDMSNYIEGLRVVLANGEVIETRRLSKRELSKKLGLATFEGEVYRSIDTLFEENYTLIDNLTRQTARNNAGYGLANVKRKDGSFDLSALIAGSQGTLGLITEVTLRTEAHHPKTTLLMAKFDSLEQIQNAVNELRDLPERPSAIEYVDENVLNELHQLNPNQLKEVIAPPFPMGILLVEFDGSERAQKKASKKGQQILNNYAVEVEEATEPEHQQNLWKVRQATSMLIGHNKELLRAVPLFDAAVSPVRLREYMEGLYSLLEVNAVRPPAVWGHIGDGLLHVQPLLNLGQVGDRQKVFRLLDEYNRLVLGLSGTVSAETGDGRLRTPYLEAEYGPELYALLYKIKQIFDPYGTLNPGVKFGTTIDDIKELIRPEYSLEHIYTHLPRS